MSNYFAIRLDGKNWGKTYDKLRSGKLELFKTISRAPIIDRFWIKASPKVLTLALNIFFSKISLWLLRICLWIVFYKPVNFKIILITTSRYIIPYKKIIKRLTLSSKLFSELLLSSVIYK